MAYRNVFVSKKRTMIVFLSLILGLVTFLCTTTIVKSIDSEKYINSMLDSDIEIENVYVKNNKGDSYLSDSLTPNLISNIEKIDGVEKVYKQTEYKISIQYNNGFDSYSQWMHKTFNIPIRYIKNTFYSNLVGISPEMLESYNTISKQDLKNFKEGKTFYISNGYKGQFTLPEKVTATPNQTDTILTLKNGGFIDTGVFVSDEMGMAPNLIISSDALNKLVDENNTQTTRLFIYTDQKKQVQTIHQVNKYLKNIQGIKSESKEDIRNEVKFMKQTINTIGGGFSLVLVFIGLMNFVNIMASSIQSRKSELSAMESIGMTQKQINQMLVKEGLYYSFISLTVVWTFGTALSYLMVTLLKKAVSYAVFDFPWLAMILISLLVFVICFIIPKVSIKSLFKEPLTQRIRNE